MKTRVHYVYLNTIDVPYGPKIIGGPLVGRNIMSIAHRSSADSLARENHQTAPLAASWNIGPTTGACNESGRLTSSLWEGLYIDQSHASASSTIATPKETNPGLETFLATLMYDE
jgi:hypothetical protein